MGNPQSGRVVAYIRERSLTWELFIAKFKSQFKRGFTKVFVNCSRNQSQSLSRVVARRASTVYLPGFMKTRLANILLFSLNFPCLSFFTFLFAYVGFFVVLCLGICVEVPNALFGYNSVRCPYKTVSVLSGYILGNICKLSVRTKETVCYILVSVSTVHDRSTFSSRNDVQKG